MKKLAPLVVLLVAVAVAVASPLSASTWKGAALMDAGCAAKQEFTAHPESHPKACALQCSKAGYGLMLDSKFVKFDKKGDDLAAAALKKTEKKDHLTATVTGELKDGTIQVASLTLD